MAQDTFTAVEAQGSVAEAADRLAAAVEAAGAKLIARVNHAGAAASVDMDLNDAELLIFGNPRLGTPAMQTDLRAGLMLPLRVLVYDAGGQTRFLYQDPAAMLAGLSIPADAEVVQKITGALARVTGVAAE